MNRLFPTAALLLSCVALLFTALLWRDVQALRSQAAADHPLRHPITDEQFTRVKEFVDYMHDLFYKQGRCPRSDVLTADQLLDKARYLHGEISRDEWRGLFNKTEGERMRLDVARLQAGAGTIADIQLLQDDTFETSR